MPNFSTYFLLATVAFMAASCEISNPEEPIPSYVKVQSYSVETDYDNEGSTSSNIHDVWFQHNGKIVATIPIPANCPILQEDGKTEVIIYPGIKENAISTSRAIYPFFEPHRFDLDFEPNSTTRFTDSNLVFRYKDNAKFLWIEDFEDETVSLQAMSPETENFRRTRGEQKVYEGQGSLLSELNTGQSIMAIQSFQKWQKDDFKIGVPTYLELDYKTQEILQLGFVIYTPDGITSIDRPFLFLNSTDTWKKNYVNLTDYLAQMRDGDEIRLYFASTLSDSTSTAEMLLDNIKMITLE